MNHGVEDMTGVLVTEVGRFGDERWLELSPLILHRFPSIDLLLVGEEFLVVRFECVIAIKAPGILVQLCNVHLCAFIVPLDCGRHPAFNWCSSVCLHNDSHRNTKSFLKRLAEVVGNRRCHCGGFGGTGDPF